MDAVDHWFDFLESLNDQIERTLQSEAEAIEAITNIISHASSPIEGLVYDVTCPSPFQGSFLGSVGSGEATHVTTIDLRDRMEAQCRICIWRKTAAQAQNSFDAVRVIEHLSRFIRNYWKSSLRDDRSAILSLQHTQTYDLMAPTLSKLLQDHEVVSVFYCDLDNFKAVNDHFGEPTGDRVILQFASILDRAVRPKGIALHRGGDEFRILLASGSTEVPLTLAYEVMKAAREYDFEIGDLSVGVSAGVAVVRKGDGAISYRDIERRAELGLKPEPGAKHRGKVRFGEATDVTIPQDTPFTRNLALCLLKTGLETQRPFESPWLNMISTMVVDTLSGNPVGMSVLSERVNGLINWIQPTLDPDVLISALPIAHREFFEPRFSQIDCVLAVAHGAFYAWRSIDNETFMEKLLQIRYQEDKGYCSLVLLPDEVVLLEIGEISTELVPWNLGGIVTVQDGETTAIDFRRALLLKIGNEDHFAVPNCLFTDTIIIDDRPTRGGGLPDFWEKTIATLIDLGMRYPNVAGVYVLGNHQYGSQTIERLRDVASWHSDPDKLSYKTAMPIHAIKSAASQFEGKVDFPNTVEILIANLAELVLPYVKLKPSVQSVDVLSDRIISRSIVMEDLALRKEDGCRVKTIAEAYPVVLELARNAEADTIKDQAGLDLKELVDFKVHLANPKNSQIPKFYAQESASLERYFEAHFLNPNGLFRERLDADRQLEQVLQHTAETIGDVSRQFATRRAILVVPHVVEEGLPLSPLGLVSVRLLPRFHQGSVVINYSYTWRTVEALVGFPYSLYGSVRFSEFLTEEVVHRLPADFGRMLEMGEVSYIAHSLHIFIDDYGQNIARRIVDDATK